MQTGSFTKLGIRDERIKTAGFDFDKHEGKFVKKLVVVAKSPNGEGDIQALTQFHNFVAPICVDFA